MNYDVASAIFNRVNTILNRTTDKYYRPILNSDFHILDFSFASLKASSPDLTEVEYNTLLSKIKLEYKEFNDLELAVTLLKDPSSITKSALVKDIKYGTYIIGYSYKAVQDKLSNILKSTEHSSVFTNVDPDTGNTITNIGHIPGKESQALVSPLSKKISDAIKIVPSGPARIALLRKAVALYKAHKFEVEYEFHRPDFNISGFNKILGKATVLVTLQTKERNAKFANEVESVINREIKQLVLEPGFFEALMNTPGSNSIKQDIIKSILANIEDTKTIPGSKHGKKPLKKKAVTTTAGNVSINSIAFKYNAPRNLSTGQFSSVINLRNLLNFHLHDVVAANMGKGQPPSRLLNFQTGRLATSTEVERVGITRQGEVLAFYNYMKNPYATFSEGGKQQYPRSRDPKLLISKSIRQIATTMGINRMRAILV